MSPGPTEEEARSPEPRSPGHHIELVDAQPTPPRHEGEASPGLRDSKGWDGKLRVPKSTTLANPEALSDPEYSDEDNVVPGEEIAADEGKQSQYHLATGPWNHPTDHILQLQTCWMARTQTRKRSSAHTRASAPYLPCASIASPK